MKFLISVVLIALLSLVVCFYFPWWSIAFVAFLVTALIPQKPLWSFLAGFTGLFLLWSVLAGYLSSKNNHILAHKISLLILQTNSAILLVLFTALIGGLVAGFAALAGSYTRSRRVEVQ